MRGEVQAVQPTLTAHVHFRGAEAVGKLLPARREHLHHRRAESATNCAKAEANDCGCEGGCLVVPLGRLSGH
jgi:hypothetical protein